MRTFTNGPPSAAPRSSRHRGLGTHLLPLWFLVAAGGAAGCSDDSLLGDAEDPRGPGADAGNGGGAPGPSDPGETPEPLRLSEPVRSGRWLFLSNPSSGTLAKMAFDGGRPRIATIPLGVAATELVAVDESGRVAAIDEAGERLLIVEAAPFGSTDRVRRATLPRGVDTMTVVDDGRWLVAWDDADLNGSSGAGLSTVVAVRITEDGMLPVIPVAVGAFPYEVAGTATGGVVVLSSEGISSFQTADLTGPSIAPPRPLDDDTSVGSRVRAAVGTRVLVGLRRDAEELTLVEAASGTAAATELEGTPGALVLAATAERAVITFPDAGEVARASFGAWPDEAPTIERFASGAYRDAAVTDEGDAALLFQAGAGRTDVELITFDGGERVELDVQLAVANAVVLPGQRIAVVLQQEGSRYGFTVADFDRSVAKTFESSRPVTHVAWSDATGTVLVLTGDDQGGVLHAVARESLVGRTTALRNRPVALGALDDAGVAWVMESHPLGRITFIDILTRDVSTITGFELNALIE